MTEFSFLETRSRFVWYFGDKGKKIHFHKTHVEFYTNIIPQLKNRVHKVNDIDLKIKFLLKFHSFSFYSN